MLRRAHLPLVLALAACTDKGADSAGDSCDPGDVADGLIEAEVDGAAWTGAELQWSGTGAGLQLTSALGAGDTASDWRITLVANDSLDAIEAGDLPLTLPMDAAGEQAWALLYPAAGDSFSSKAGAGGAVTFAALDGDALRGCVAFDAAGSGGEASLSGGRFSAVRR